MKSKKKNKIELQQNHTEIVNKLGKAIGEYQFYLTCLRVYAINSFNGDTGQGNLLKNTSIEDVISQLADALQPLTACSPKEVTNILCEKYKGRSIIKMILDTNSPTLLLFITSSVNFHIYSNRIQDELKNNKKYREGSLKDAIETLEKYTPKKVDKNLINSEATHQIKEKAKGELKDLARPSNNKTRNELGEIFGSSNGQNEKKYAELFSKVKILDVQTAKSMIFQWKLINKAHGKYKVPRPLENIISEMISRNESGLSLKQIYGDKAPPFVQQEEQKKNNRGNDRNIK